MLISRRSLITSTTSALLASAPAVALPLRRTTSQTPGPFYPVARPLDQDSDLTRLRGSSGVARGRAINVVGQVVDRWGRAVPNARLDLWQANAAGRYAHPGDTSPAPLDPNFQGSTRLLADAEGRFRIRTIRPGAYGTRTPHIHFDISSRSQRTVTQMYFPGEPLNDQDGLLAELSPENRATLIAHAIAPLADDPTAPAYTWRVVLSPG